MSREAAKERYEQQPGEPSIGFVDTVDVIAAIDITYDDMEAGDSAVLDAVGGVSDASGARFDVIEADEWVVEGRLAAGAVTSDKILNGSIQDEDINAAANIAPTKIAGTALTAESMSIFNALDYGADPTGVVDSTAEINAALTAGAGGVVIIPAGTYKTSATLVVPADTALRLHNGATIVPTMTIPTEGASTDTTLRTITLAAGSTLEGGRILSQDAHNSHNSKHYYAIVWVEGDDVTVRNVTLDRVPRCGIHTLGTNITITGCRIDGNVADEYYVTGETMAHHAIIVDPEGDPAEGDANGNVIVSNNIIIGCVNGVSPANWWNVGDPGHGLVITNNVFYRCHGHGIYICGHAGYVASDNEANR